MADPEFDLTGGITLLTGEGRGRTLLIVLTIHIYIYIYIYIYTKMYCILSIYLAILALKLGLKVIRKQAKKYNYSCFVNDI